MTDEHIMQTLADVGAIITDSHVVYTSGRHGTAYVNKDALFLHPRVIEQLSGTMAQAYNADEIDVVAGPTVGGVILSQWIAWHLTVRRTDGGETLAVFAEEEGEGDARRRIFKRGYDLQLPGKRVAVVEDILTTGGSARKVIAAVREMGGQVIGLSAICNRGGITAADMDDIPIHALTSVTLESWPATDCPMCQAGVPVNTQVGKGRAFLAEQH